jgi:hypothetical protein
MCREMIYQHRTQSLSAEWLSGPGIGRYVSGNIADALAGMVPFV